MVREISRQVFPFASVVESVKYGIEDGIVGNLSWGGLLLLRNVLGDLFKLAGREVGSVGLVFHARIVPKTEDFRLVL